MNQVNASEDKVTSVVLLGVGGQGILLASEIMARAAMHAGFDVKTNEVHGMAQRGGSVIAQVRYGQKVYSPLIAERTADVLASFEKVEAVRGAHYVKSGGLAVIANTQIIPTTVSSGLCDYPADIDDRLKNAFSNLSLIDAQQKAVELGNVKAANVVLMGGLSVGLDLPLDVWHEGVKTSVKPKFLELNLKAFDEGRAMTIASQSANA
ncbi:indolepyruvate oxidoreductase subunit beta [Poriferisphaera corsica]|uniref:Indolepyruvate oxidoreductase subunit beta n=1 Tax=Poriferisphaera corsica TaxID=2528020 RepID=A0A517YPD0_9BACT|nr:indolepyruvate oxidoreductase subunit beta [Poriferisphaera corsica]QDU32085.1 indolepyruvate oxidoreductase subunit beta [Poriferisphaera corsica]